MEQWPICVVNWGDQNSFTLCITACGSLEGRPNIDTVLSDYSSISSSTVISQTCTAFALGIKKALCVNSALVGAVESVGITPN